MILLTILSATNTCKKTTIIVPENEWGYIEYYGQIIGGVIEDELMIKIHDKTVAVISRAALNDYMLLKRYAKKHDIDYK